MMNIQDKLHELEYDELRAIAAGSEDIQAAVYDWLKESDSDYAGDQTYEYDADELADRFAESPEYFADADPDAVRDFLAAKFSAQCEAYTNGYTSAVSEIMSRGDVFTGRTDDEKILAVEWQFPGGLGAYLTDSLRPAFLAGLDDAFYAIERMKDPENVVTIRTR